MEPQTTTVNIRGIRLPQTKKRTAQAITEGGHGRYVVTMSGRSRRDLNAFAVWVVTRTGIASVDFDQAAGIIDFVWTGEASRVDHYRGVDEAGNAGALFERVAADGSTSEIWIPGEHLPDPPTNIGFIVNESVVYSSEVA